VKWRRETALSVAVLLAVVVTVVMLKPSSSSLRWEAVKARHETRESARIFTAASRIPLRGSLLPGTYAYRAPSAHPDRVKAVLSLPKGAQAARDAPFTYTLTPNMDRDAPRTVTGTVTLTGSVLVLHPDRANWLLNVPEDRSLIQQVSPQGFELLSPQSAETGESDTTTFIRVAP